MPAWVTPTQKPAGTKITAAIWDQDVVFNPQALKGQLGTVVIEDSIQIPDAKWMGRSANAGVAFDSTLTAINATGSVSFAIDADNSDADTQAFTWWKNAPNTNGTELMRLNEAGRLLLGATGHIGLTELSATPADPTSNTQVNIYLKADKLVFQFNNGGTVRYKYLDLTGTGVTWVHDTAAP